MLIVMYGTSGLRSNSVCTRKENHTDALQPYIMDLPLAQNLPPP